MIALDTNIIVRLLLADAPAQTRRAAALMESEPEVLVTATVVLETEWVLRAGGKFSVSAVNVMLRKFLSLPNVTLQDADAVWSALDLHAAGMDFADALHLMSARNADRFVTFDRDFVRQAAKLKAVPQVVAP